MFDADGRLLGGLFGLAVGQLFCGDSMYSAHSGASTLALAALCRRLHGWGWPLLDAQVPNAHTRRLGVETWPRADYLAALARLRDAPGRVGPWTHAFGTLPAAEVVASTPG